LEVSGKTGAVQETPMSHLGSMPDPKDKPRTLLVGWISRLDLALELGLSLDTLRQWDSQSMSPPSVRAGRKVYYRRAAVEEWLEEQEQNAPRCRLAGGRR
jgi:predicted DNA-binding transcriptional regulator AlpA